MALLTKVNVPLEPFESGTDEDNLYGEVAKIQSLAATTNRSTTGAVSWQSPTSGITYNTNAAAYSSMEDIYNKGENGLFNLLLYLYGEDISNNKRFLITSDDWNSVINAIVDYSTGDAAVGKASKIATTQAIGSATQPVYVRADGVVTPATSYANATVGNALNANNATNATNATTASKLGSANVGSNSSPIWLNAGVPTECSNVTAGTATTATRLTTPRTLQVNLASTSASTGFDGSANVADIGVSGSLGVANGGTGLTSNPTIAVDLTSTSATSLFSSSVRPGVTGTLAIGNGGTGVSTSKGSATKPVYLGSSGIAACTYSLGANVNAGTSGKLAVYGANGTNLNEASGLGSATKPVYLNDGAPTACTYELKSTVNNGTANKLAYYSGANAVSSYASSVGGSQQLMYLNSGVPTAGIKITYGANLPSSGMSAGDVFIKI